MTIYQIRDVLMWCSVINLVLMVISFLLVSVARSWAYNIHNKLFGISESQFNVVAYSSLAAYKLLVFVFNIIPWIALCIMT